MKTTPPDNLSPLPSHLPASGTRVPQAGQQLETGTASGQLSPGLPEKNGEKASDAIHFSEEYSYDKYRDISLIEDQEYYEASYAQRRLWLLHQFGESRTAYNVVEVIPVKGKLQEPALEKAVGQLLERHESLRTSFLVRGGAVRQRIHAYGSLAFPVRYLDLENEPDQDAALQECLDQAAAVVFDLERAPLLAITVIRRSREEYVFCMVMHHIITDDWSVKVLTQELAHVYSRHVAGKAARLPPLTVQYRHYSAWQKRLLEKRAHQHRASWQKRLAGELPVLVLPTDFARPGTRNYRGGSSRLWLGAELREGLAHLEQQAGVSPFMVLVAALNGLLFRYTGQEDILIGTPVSGRQHADLEHQVGFYVNTVVFRCRFSGKQSFRELLGAVKQVVLEAFEHQQYPFDQLVEDLHAGVDRSRNPLFDVLITYQQEDVAVGKEDGITRDDLSWRSPVKTSRFDLTYRFQEHKGGIALKLDYNADLFLPGRIGSMTRHVEQWLTALVGSPDTPLAELDYLHGTEKEALTALNHAPDEYPAHYTLKNLLEEQAAQMPGAVAVRFGDQLLTYQALHELTNQLARLLQQKGVGPETLVPVCLGRSPALVIAVVAIIKAGGAYVPVDPEHPQERIRHLLRDTNARLVLCDGSTYAKLGNPEGIECFRLDQQWDRIREMPAENTAADLRPHHLAYVIYTSGSTGRPKGVMVEHKSLLNYLLFSKNNYQSPAGRGSYAHLSLSFDASLTALFVPLLSAKTLVLAADNILELFTEEGYGAGAPYDFVKLTPAHLTLLPEGAAATGRLVVGGEALHYGQLAWLNRQAGSTEVINEYGPTEAAVGCCVYTLQVGGGRALPAGSVPIGKPVANTQLYVLDDRQQLLPAGVAGELYIGGVQVARGYLNQEALTKERFIANPFGEGQLYRTGDLVKRLGDGNLEYLGRKDEQVKIRGYRIEPGEIEAVLGGLPGVSQAIVLVLEEAEGEKHLSAYYQGELSPEQVRDRMGQVLPAYMVPAYLKRLAEFPLTLNGKVDRQALRQSALPAAAAPPVEAPGTPAEALVQALFRQVLAREHVGREDSFFALGGYSLKAMRLLTRLHEQTGLEMSLRQLFEHPTVSAIAALVEKASTRRYQPIPLALGQREDYALSHAQQRLWLLQQQEPVAYNMPFAFWLEADLAVEAFEKAWQGLLERHESLRTAFVEKGGQPRQKILPAAEVVLPFLFEDLRAQADRLEQVRAAAGKQARVEFDLGRAPLLRVALYQVEDGRYVLLLNLHHIICDGWSLQVLQSELHAFYEAFRAGVPPQLEPLSIHYKDYAHWHNGWLESEDGQKQKGYWLGQFAGEVPHLQLPADFPRPARKAYKGHSTAVTLGAALSERLHALAAGKGTSAFTVLMAGVKALLYRYSGETDLVVGVPIAGRQHPDLQKQVGFYINTLALRTRFSGEDSFGELVDKVHQGLMEAYENQAYPYDELVGALGTGGEPLFNVGFTWHDAYTQAARQQSDWHMEPYQSDFQAAKADLWWHGRQNEQGDLLLRLDYDTDLFAPERMQRMLGHLEGLLGAGVAGENERLAGLDYLPVAEREQLLTAFNHNAAAHLQSGTAVDLFEAQAAQTPDAVANMRRYVLDGRQQLLPVGVDGELYIGGGQVARDYPNREEPTEAKCIANPFGEGRLYRTGDLARWLGDGTLEYLGRVDEQVRISGHRIRLGEVNTKLTGHEAVENGVVAARSVNGEPTLVAYVQWTGSGDEAGLRAYMQAALPAYMRPVIYVSLSALPLTAGGKVDKERLPVPEAAAGPAGQPAMNELEERMMHIWEEVFQRKSIGVEDDFFQLGGHSLKAIKMARLIYWQFNRQLNFKTIFTYTTIRALCRQLDNGSPAPPKPGKPSGPIPKVTVNGEDYYELTYIQRYWVDEEQDREYKQLDKRHGMMAIMLGITGPLQVEAFRAAVQWLIARHESLRTTFHYLEEKHLMKIGKTESFAHLPEYWDITGKPVAEEEADRFIYFHGHQFDFEKGPLFVIRLLKHRDDQYKMCFRLHHILGDTWSNETVVRDLFAAYLAFKQGARPNLPALEFQFKEHVAFLIEQKKQYGQLQREYWRRLYPTLPAEMVIPVKRKKETSALSERLAEIVYFSFPDAVYKRMLAWAGQCQTSLFVVVQAAFRSYLCRRTGQRDLLMGTYAHAREYPGLPDQIGSYARTAVTRVVFGENDAFREQIGKVKKANQDLIQYDAFPLMEWIQEILPEGQSLKKLWRVNFQFRDATGHQRTSTIFKELAQQYDVVEIYDPISRMVLMGVDMQFTLIHTDTKLDVLANYDSSLYGPEAIETMLSDFVAYLHDPFCANGPEAAPLAAALPTREN